MKKFIYKPQEYVQNMFVINISNIQVKRLVNNVLPYICSI